MRVLVTGAGGFVGGWLVPRLLEDGHEVVAAVGPDAAPDRLPVGVSTCRIDLRTWEGMAELRGRPCEAVIHLAAVSAPSEQEGAVAAMYDVNVGGTARVLEVVKSWAADRTVRFLHVSSGLVYGASGRRPFTESDVPAPVGPYAASKLASEIPVRDASRGGEIEAVIARPFSHTGAGQDGRFVIPAFARRILDAVKIGGQAIGVGNLEPVRDFLHVADVVDAYVRMVTDGVPGAVYNVASGQGVSIGAVFDMVNDAAGTRVIPEVDAALVRSRDASYSVGDAARLRTELGWRPSRALEQTIREVVDAQAD